MTRALLLLGGIVLLPIGLAGIIPPLGAWLGLTWAALGAPAALRMYFPLMNWAALVFGAMFLMLIFRSPK